MNNISMTKIMEKELDSFLATRTITDVDRTKFIPFVLRDNINKLTTCLMFNCNCHSYEDPTIIPCEYTGAVIHLPAFWVEVPKELAFTYICDLINDLYKSTYQQWVIDGKIGNTGSSNNTGVNTPNTNNNCGCGCNPGWQLV